MGFDKKMIMKKFKKSEIAIYAVALMLVAAGYFNYSTFEGRTEETYSEDINSIGEQYANVGDAVLVSNNEVENNVNDVATNTNISDTKGAEISIMVGDGTVAASVLSTKETGDESEEPNV